ncbi:MAG: hypothetical protein WDM79_04110 [Terricaulis sp.]
MTPTTTDTRGRRGSALVEGEYLFTAEDSQRIASLLYQQSGISLNESKAALVYFAAGEALTRAGAESFRDYCELVAGAAAWMSVRRC